MKRVVLSMMVLALVAVGAHAQTPHHPNTFPTMEACAGALHAGHFRFYEPRYFGLKGQDPVDNRERIVVPLETDSCLEMLTVGGRRFVVQREGTLFRARRQADGSLTLYARDDCGNPVYGFNYLAPEVEVKEEPVRAYVHPRPPDPLPPPMSPAHREPKEPKRRGGFCSSTKCKVAIVALVGSAAGYAAWRYWPCPPGTVRR